MPTEHELIEERRKKRDELIRLGINPYPYSYHQTHHAEELKETYSGLQPEEETQDTVKIAGRIIGLRRMGKASFVHVLDQTGKIQSFFKQDILGDEKYKQLKWVKHSQNKRLTLTQVQPVNS